MIVGSRIASSDDRLSAALPIGLRGLNAHLMNQYVEYVADFLLWRLGFSTIYGKSNPVCVPLALLLGVIVC